MWLIALGIPLVPLVAIIAYANQLFRDTRQAEAEWTQLMWHRPPQCPRIGPYTPADERLRHAAGCGDLATVKLLLREKLPPDAAESAYGARQGQTALHFAAEQDRTSVIDVLVAAHANVNARASAGTTPLHLASDRGRMAAVKTLLQHGADPNVLDQQGSPLHRALLQGRSDIAALLLDRGADPNARTPTGLTPLMAVAGVGIAYPDRERLTRRLIAAGADVNARDESGNTALHAVAYRGPSDQPIETAKALVAAGADVTVRNNLGRTALDVLRSRDPYAPDAAYERLLSAATH